MNFIDKVTKTIQKYNLINQNDSILIALSGGPDSVALLKILSLFQKKMRLSLLAVYINHNIRPKAAKAEAQFCSALCAKLKIELILISEDIPALAKKEKKGLEETGRNYRYQVFNDLAKTNQIDKIAFGHHRDDQVETILFRIIRGTGRAGLRGIQPKRDNIIRPLYDCTKDEILKFLKSRKLAYCLDRSNEKNDFTRNYIRNRLLPDLKKQLNPVVDKALLNLSDNLKDEELYLENITNKKLKQTVSATPGGINEIDLSKFNKLDNWIKKRILRDCLSSLTKDKTAPDKSTVEALLEMIESGANSLSLPGEIQSENVNDTLLIFKRNRCSFNLDLKLNGVIEINPINRKIKTSVVKANKIQFIKKKQAAVVYLDLEQIKLPLTARNILPGDRFKPLGLKGTKKVGDYLTDKKVPKPKRDEIPVISDQNGIIWLAGWEIDNRVKIKSKTDEVLKIELL